VLFTLIILIKCPVGVLALQGSQLFIFREKFLGLNQGISKTKSRLKTEAKNSANILFFAAAKVLQYLLFSMTYLRKRLRKTLIWRGFYCHRNVNRHVLK